VVIQTQANCVLTSPATTVLQDKVLGRHLGIKRCNRRRNVTGKAWENRYHSQGPHSPQNLVLECKLLFPPRSRQWPGPAMNIAHSAPENKFGNATNSSKIELRNENHEVFCSMRQVYYIQGPYTALKSLTSQNTVLVNGSSKNSRTKAGKIALYYFI